jgi:hypothetical protein
MSQYELAQLNIGIIKAPMDSPVMAEFAANLGRINALAEQSPGFVWRLQTEDGDATGIRPFETDNLLVNMSVWRDVASLSQYVYSSAQVVRTYAGDLLGAVVGPYGTSPKRRRGDREA